MLHHINQNDKRGELDLPLSGLNGHSHQKNYRLFEYHPPRHTHTDEPVRTNSSGLTTSFWGCWQIVAAIMINNILRICHETKALFLIPDTLNSLQIRIVDNIILPIVPKIGQCEQRIVVGTSTFSHKKYNFKLPVIY